MVFCAFDLLYLGGYDLTHVLLLDRKTLLAGCLDELPAGGSASASTLKLTARRCCRRPAASVLKESSKRKDQPYRSGRLKDWLKTSSSSRVIYYVPSSTPTSRTGCYPT